MTICIAALADEGKAVVCIADKMLSFSSPLGDYIQWESDVTKIIPIRKTSVIALIAGGISECDAVLNEIYGIENPDDNLTKLMYSLETAFKNAFSHYQEISVLHRRGISKSTYEAAITTGAASSLIQDISSEMREYSFDCDVVLCGINNYYQPYIVSVSSPGHVKNRTREGFTSVGIGADVANPRMLWSGYKRSHSIGRVLFDLFDAKANAEMKPGVGFKWDAVVIFADDGLTYLIPDDVKRLIESSWEEHNRSPFEEWNADEDLPRPPNDWRDRILAISKSDLKIIRTRGTNPRSTKADQTPPPPSLE